MTIIEREKAIELYEKMYRKMPKILSEKRKNETTKHCLVIAIEEIINDSNASSPFEEERIKYWVEVKSEAKNL